MKRPVYLLLILVSLLTAASCHPNPHNTFGGPSEAKDTAASQRDTMSTGTRTDR